MWSPGNSISNTRRDVKEEVGEEGEGKGGRGEEGKGRGRKGEERKGEQRKGEEGGKEPTQEMSGRQLEIRIWG